MSSVKKIPYVRLGKSGLKVSKIILGCMSYGSKGWSEWVIDDQEEVNKHIKFAYDHGIQTFDTANVYSNGLSEIMLGKAIKDLQLPREELVILTKLFSPVAPDYDTQLWGRDPQEVGIINQQGLSRKHIFDSVKKSLERLQVEYIDVYQCHRFDYDTPIEETMQALHDVVQAGYVRYIGMSSCHAYQFHAMQNYAIQNKLTPFISMQNHHSLIYREEEREMFPTLKLFGVGAIPWSPLGRGNLTRPLSAQTKRSETDAWAGPLKQWAGTADIVNRVEEISKKKGVSMAQVAIAWSLSKDGVTAPIVGTTSLKNLEDIIGAVNVELTEDEIKYLEEPYKPLEVFGHT
ncbi:aryl-alcohol dehydrogenase [Rhodofomes roseus]|uniref:Aryl-alcohol dehydrogenase n=1 Tax=Rhodofomes roseus TaxID=34475 RepID=A0ABQ8KQU1_9APHY|nr:aryl-alcohol dehydrogenase [Rhodofomes roseus]KAH9840762.1 aryl-alcohol dehydrogenase [Rhodofomes roseus]